MIRLKGLLTAVVTLTISATLCCCSHGGTSNTDLDRLYREVDEEIGRNEVYTVNKGNRIEAIRQDYAKQDDTRAKLRMAYDLVEEYEAFKSDSALHYIEIASNLASQLDDRREQLRLMIKKADIASHAGLFAEAHELLTKVPRANLDTALLINYYSAYSSLYQYECEYLPAEYSDNSRELRNLYIDSLLQVSSIDNFNNLINWAAVEIGKDNQAEVEKRLTENLNKYAPGMRQYSILASILAYMHETLGHEEEQRSYLAQTVISDIKGAIKENMALRQLATKVFEDGEIDRANRYLKASFDDANFFSARMRNAQSSRLLPVIDNAYDTRQKRLQKMQRTLIWVISGLVIILVAGVLMILKQKRKVETANQKVEKSNRELQAMSEQLEHVNKELEKTNRALKRTNKTTEEYAGLFMEFSSVNIASLEKYHLALRNLALQGNVKGILKKLDSGDIAAGTLRVFYSKFDEAILNIYPLFIDKVNTLLKPDSRIMLKWGEKLNTELRIIALIRIGINDSEKMAQFLRCSLSTIYTYRSKMKRRAINPDDFENQVAEL